MDECNEAVKLLQLFLEFGVELWELVQKIFAAFFKEVLELAGGMLSLQGAAACLQTASMLAEAFQCEIQPVGMLPAMVDRRYSLTAFVLSALQEMSERYGVPLLHAIRTDGNVPKAERARQFLVDYSPDSRASEDYVAAADELKGLLDAAEQRTSCAQAISA